jgi:hypothetical protein
MAYKTPKCYDISILQFYSQHEFSEFDICGGSFSGPHIIPHNPHDRGTEERGDFEAFRQSMNAVIHLAGQWPTDIKVVPKEHVQFRWTEFMDSVPSFNYQTLRNGWSDRLDVQEYAYYVGPIDDMEVHEIDVNAVYERADYLLNKLTDEGDQHRKLEIS